MSNRLLYFLLFLFLCEKANTFIPEDEELFKLGAQRPHLKYLFFASCFILIGLIDYFLKSYEIIVSNVVFCIILGVLFGIGAMYVQWMYRVAWSTQTHTIINAMADIYIPIITFGTAFTLDMHTFFKALTQIIIVSIPVSILIAFVTGIMMQLMLDESWSFDDALLFGLILTGIYPIDILDWVKESNVQTKYVMSLLHGETLLATVVAIIGYDTVILHAEGWVTEWYQFVMGLVRVCFGIPLGYAFGLLGASLMKVSYSNAPLLILLTISACFTSFFVTLWLSNGGILATMITGIMMGIERPSLSHEIQATIVDVWKMFSLVVNGVVCIMIGIRTPWMLSDTTMVKDYILVLVTYLVCNVSRFLSYFVFSPILSRIGYGMSFQNMILCVWCGLKNPLCLSLVLDLYDERYMEENSKKSLFFLHVIGVFFIMALINGTFVPVLLKALGLSDISPSRQANMNNCMKYINEARSRTIAILKMDRFLSDANWPLVIASTGLKHPYKKTVQIEEEQDEEEDENFFMGYRFTFCPDCQKDIPNEPTPKEIKEMTKEAKFRILKLKKTAYSRQYENGMISREGVRTLHQSVEIAMDTEDAIIELDGLLEMFTKEGYIYKKLQSFFQQFLQVTDKIYRPPRRKHRLFCYRIIQNSKYWIVMTCVLFVHMVLVCAHLLMDIHTRTFEILIATGAFAFFTVYLAEFVIKIFAYSWIKPVYYGLKTYFSSVLNIMECFSMLWTLVRGITKVISFHTKGGLYIDILSAVLLCVRIIRNMHHLKMFVFLDPILLTILKFLDSQLNKHRSLAYELGKNFIAGEEEILENLPLIVDNLSIQKKMKDKTELDRHIVSNRMGLSQKERPGVASTVKTKAAMRAVLNSMKNDIYELKVSGWVDDLEDNKLLLSLSERYKCVNSLKFVPPSSPKMLFRTVPFMGEDEELVDYLYSNVATRKFDPGNIIVEEGEIATGIYILITGMFLVNYIPNETVLNLLKEEGALPVIDHLCSNTYDEPTSEYFLPGNTIGELSTLTGRTYDGQVTAECHSEVYFLSSTIIKQALSIDPDPVNGLECRIWKNLAFRTAVEVMMTVPSYRSHTQERIKYLVERGFVPNLSGYKVFVVNDMMQDIILIEGVVVDYNTRDVYTAPTYIPRAVQKLVFPKSSLVNMQVNVETKLMILPAKDFDEYEIMINEEQNCELETTESTKSLRRLLKDSGTGGAKEAKQHKGLLITKLHRKKLIGSETTRSKITFASGVPKKS